VIEVRKELRISEVIATNASNVPLQIVLAGGHRSGKDIESSLTLDAATCARHKIPKIFSLVGRTIVCTFRSREIPLLQKEPWQGQIDFGAIEDDCLEIESLNREETIRPNSHIIPAGRIDETLRTLVLSSFSKGGKRHSRDVPCPFYQFILWLTEGEYEACKLLPVNSMFKVDFHLLK